ncbi:MAG TPA: NnrS family protein [Pseudolabrys sp.]|nr:NnrS family protein [Pseudolabrys sp.]
MSIASAAPAALQRRRAYAGPALFAYGFRPFFLAAGLWGAFGILVWLPQFLGLVTLPTAFGPLDWHIHEMLYGYVAAAIAGFLLTAIPNWTGRLPVSGWPLAGLASLWLAGRLAILFSADIGGIAAAAVDVSFLLTLAAVAAREIVAGKNWRNLRVLVVLGVLAAGNVVFHAEVLTRGAADYGIRIALAAVLVLIMLIGGRIVPSFTNNWLARNNPGRKPAPFARLDMVTIAASVVALAAWIAAPFAELAGVLLLIAGALHAVRLARWAGDRTLADRLVLILHIAYAFIPLGFLLSGAAILALQVPPSAGIHAWTAGAIGLMTLAVMTRATLGHTGHALHAGPATQAIYGLVLLAALLRIVAAFTGSLMLMEYAGGAWIVGFAAFTAVYGRLLIMRKPAWAAAKR